MPAHAEPSRRRQLRTTVLTSVATALAVVGLMVAGSALTSSPSGREPATTAGPVALLDAPIVPTPTTSTGARTSTPPRTTTTKPPTTTSKPPRTTTTTTSREDDDG